MPAEGQRRRSVVQAAAIAAKQPRMPSRQREGRPPELSVRAQLACREATRHVRSRKAKAAIRAAFADGVTPEIIAGWIAAGVARLEQDLVDEQIEPEVYHQRLEKLIDQARKLVDGLTRAVPVYDAPPLVNINIGLPEEASFADGPGDIVEIG